MEKKRKKEKQIVVKDNSLIQISKLSMNLSEMKAFSYIIAQIPNFNNIDEDGFISFRQADFCRACGIEIAGRNYSNLKQTLRKLAQRIVEINTKDKWVAFQVLSKVEIVYQSETIKVKIHENMKQLIFNLKQRFTTYQLENVLRLKSKYAFCLYEWLKSFNTGEEVVGCIEKLNTLLCVNYKNPFDLIRRCVEPAVTEINAKTDLVVSFIRKKTDRAITALVFTVKNKSESIIVSQKDDGKALLLT